MACRKTGISLALLSCVLLTITESLLYGITSVISNKEKGTLSTPPVIFNVILMPLATPRLSAGTDPMIELVFGGINNALPKPNSIRLINTALYDDVAFRVENQINAEAFKAKPTELKIRPPYRSDSLPLIGLKTKTTISIGIRMIPALIAL